MTTASLIPAGTRTVMTTTELDSLADGSYSTRTGFTDLTAATKVPAFVNLTLSDIAGLAGSTGKCHIYAVWSDDSAGDTNAPTHTTAAPNGEWVGSIDLDGTTAVSKTFLVPVKAAEIACVLLNSSGAALGAAGGDIEVRKVDVDNS